MVKNWDFKLCILNGKLLMDSNQEQHTQICIWVGLEEAELQEEDLERNQ